MDDTPPSSPRPGTPLGDSSATDPFDDAEDPLAGGPRRARTGIGALPGRVGGFFFSTRGRAQLTIATAAALVLTIVGLALIAPRVRTTTVQGAQATQHTTTSESVAVSAGTGDVDVSKTFPRLYSSKLGIDVAIQPGDGRTPPIRPIAYQYPKTAPLGQAGNTYLYAHDRPGMFYGLHTAQVGDVVTVAMSPTQKLYYQITEIHASVAWNDFAWLQPSTDQRLTLQTCNLSGDFDPRFIVVTRPIPEAQGQALTGGA